MLRHHMKGIIACLAAFITLACGEGPLADDSSGSTQSQVRFDLRAADLPLDVCVEADLITLDVSQEGAKIDGGPSQNVGSPPPCGALFTVTVEKNREVTFTGEVLGGEVSGQERRLLIGQATLPASEAKDGFDVRIQLSELDALRVVTETIGPGPANEYTFTVDGHPNTPIGIGHNDMVVVPAVAAGSRMVDLDPSPCSVSDLLPDPRPVGVPVPSDNIGEVKFKVDCRSGVNVTTVGQSCPAGTMFDLVVDDNPPPHRKIGANDAITITSLPARLYRFELQNLPPGSQVATIQGPNIQGDNPAVVDLPVATNVDLTFLVTCVPPPTRSTQIVVTVSFVAGSPSTTIVNPLDVLIDSNLVGKITSLNRRVTGMVDSSVNPTHTVQLNPTGMPKQCGVAGSNQQLVTVPVNSTRTVDFPLECQ